MSYDAGGMAARRKVLADENQKLKCRRERGVQGSWHFHCFSVQSGQHTERRGLRLCPLTLGHGLLLKNMHCRQTSSMWWSSVKSNDKVLIRRKMFFSCRKDGHNEFFAPSQRCPFIFNRESKHYAITQCHGEAKEAAGISHHKGNPRKRYP